MCSVSPILFDLSLVCQWLGLVFATAVGTIAIISGSSKSICARYK